MAVGVVWLAAGVVVGWLVVEVVEAVAWVAEVGVGVLVVFEVG